MKFIKSSIANFWDAKWTGFKGKTLFQWLNILGVFAVPLLIGALSVQQGWNAEEDRKAEQKLVEEKQRHEIMTNYLQQMTQLILKHKLTSPEATAEVRTVARAITLNASRQLDGPRKALLLKFLYEAKLIGQCPPSAANTVKNRNLTTLIQETVKNPCQESIVRLDDVQLEETKFDSPIELPGIDLTGASLVKADLPNIALNKADMKNSILRGANLSKAFLIEADLQGSRLISADLKEASLQGAVLKFANLQNAQLQRAILIETNLEFADLKGANLIGTNLKGAKLKDARYNLQPEYQINKDGERVDFQPTRFPEGFKPEDAGMVPEVCHFGECK